MVEVKDLEISFNNRNINDFYTKEYKDSIADLIDNDLVKELDSFSQHINTSRLQHSLNVSYYGYLVAKFFNLDFRSVARAGLLHDLFLYDWREEKQPEGSHAIAHPKVALRNACSITELNDIEKDAISKHMFPLSDSFPKYKESYVVSLVDKFCALQEVIFQVSKMFLLRKNKAGNMVPKLAKIKTN